jgi:ATP-binding cassette, subfamily B, bacterial MsbA
MRTFLQIVSYIKPYWKSALLNVVFNILSAFFALFSFIMVIPFLRILFNKQETVTILLPFSLKAETLQHNFNYYLSQMAEHNEPGKAILLVSLLVVVMALLKTGFAFLANYSVTSARTGVVRDIRKKVYRKILRLPNSYFSDARKGDIMSRVGMDVNEIETSVMSSLEMAFRDPITIIVFLVSMFILSYQLTLFAIILLPVSGYLIGRIGKNLRKQSLRLQQQLGTLMSILEETLTGIRIIKAFNAEEKVATTFEKSNNTYTRIIKKVQRRKFLASPLSEFLGTLVMMVLMYVGGKLVLNETSVLTSEKFIAYLIIFSQIINPAKALSTGYYNIQKGIAAYDRVDSIFKEEVTIKDNPSPVRINKFESSIEYRNIYFTYDTEMVLKDINLTIGKGRTIAIVGRSGSGKSTLVDLLPRFIDPQRGEIYLDGRDIREYKIADLRNLLGIVSQQSILFNDTFFNNIAFGMDNANEEDVIKAARIANAHDFIMETQDGYLTNVGDAGSKLSGGQKQRISIARALLKNPPILILDEATSSLDTESEKLVQEAIIQLMKNRTSIVIAHRLSTVKHADEILVLEDGQIVESGNHNQLLTINGYYKKYHSLQMF